MRDGGRKKEEERLYGLGGCGDAFKAVMLGCCLFSVFVSVDVVVSGE
jgi:hypothetical protein